MFSLKRYRRRSVVAGLTLAIGSSLALMPAPAAHAATPFNVVGTADVFDSFLIQNVIAPGFQAQYPQYVLNYTSKGTGDALNLAKTGQFSAAIVHAASLENQFVAGGYSLEPYGRAIFYGDYVLLGPASDPAGVLANDPHDIVGAFEKIAAAGAAGHATFISRGTTAGTVVQEHKLWALSSGVTTCTVSDANGGGKAPNQSGGTCPDNLNTTDYPSWYKVTGASQSGNVGAADTCPTQTYPNGGCYVFTDRGTYNYLQSTGAIHSLQTVTRTNATTARGGSDALINIFHAYGVNPAAVPSGNQVDTVAAKDFLNYITSPAAQKAIGNYLNGTNDAPFKPAAAPTLTEKVRQSQFKTGKPTTIKGQLQNQIPGYPVLNGVTVNLLKTKTSNPLELPKIVATAVTDSAGNYQLKAKLRGGQFYQVGVGQITKIERPDLSPQFGDLLQPTSVPVGTAGSVKLKSPVRKGNRLLFKGKVKPSPQGKPGQVVLYLGKVGHKLKKVDTGKVKIGKSSFHLVDHLSAGKYHYKVVYTPAAGAITTISKNVTVTVH